MRKLSPSRPSISPGETCVRSSRNFGLHNQGRVSVIRLLRHRLVDRPAKGGRIGGRERGAGRRGQAAKHGDGEGSYRCHALTTQNELLRSRRARRTRADNNWWLIFLGRATTSAPRFSRRIPVLVSCDPWNLETSCALSFHGVALTSCDAARTIGGFHVSNVTWCLSGSADLRLCSRGLCGRSRRGDRRSRGRYWRAAVGGPVGAVVGGVGGAAVGNSMTHHRHYGYAYYPYHHHHHHYYEER